MKNIKVVGTGCANCKTTLKLNETFVLPKPKIMRPDNWLPLNPGDLLGRAGCGKSARPVL